MTDNVLEFPEEQAAEPGTATAAADATAPEAASTPNLVPEPSAGEEAVAVDQLPGDEPCAQPAAGTASCVPAAGSRPPVEVVLDWIFASEARTGYAVDLLLGHPKEDLRRRFLAELWRNSGRGSVTGRQPPKRRVCKAAGGESQKVDKAWDYGMAARAAIVDPQRVALQLEVSLEMLQHWRRIGEGPAFTKNIRGQVRYSNNAVLRFFGGAARLLGPMIQSYVNRQGKAAPVPTVLH